MDINALQSIAIFVAPAITIAAGIFVWVTQNAKAAEVKMILEQKIEATSRLLEQKIDGGAKLLEQKIDSSFKLLEERSDGNTKVLQQSLLNLATRLDGMDKTLSEVRSQQQTILARLPERDTSARASAT